MTYRNENCVRKKAGGLRGRVDGEGITFHLHVYIASRTTLDALLPYSRYIIHCFMSSQRGIMPLPTAVLAQLCRFRREEHDILLGTDFEQEYILDW